MIIQQRLVSARRPVWQGVGTTFSERISAVKALREIGGDSTVIKSQMMAAVRKPDGSLKPVAVPGRYVIFRQPDERAQRYTYYGQCGSRYEIIQRLELATAVDELTSRWPLESIGEIDGGQTILFVLNAGRTAIKGDEITMYYLLVDTLDGGTSAKSLFTPLRMQCMNQLQTAMRSATVSVALEHRTGMNRSFAFTMQMVKKMVDSQEAVMDTFEMMARTKITPEQASRIFDATYRMPKRPAKAELTEIIPEDYTDLADIRQQGVDAIAAFEYYANRATMMRESALELLDVFNTQNPQIANTAWAAYNVAVEQADWRAGSGDVDKDAMFGERANEKRRAFSAAIAETH
jgi:hypothetical protein